MATTERRTTKQEILRIQDYQIRKSRNVETLDKLLRKQYVSYKETTQREVDLQNQIADVEKMIFAPEDGTINVGELSIDLSEYINLQAELRKVSRERADYLRDIGLITTRLLELGALKVRDKVVEPL